MITPVDPTLRDEVERYRLRFQCDDCMHFDSSQGHCSHGYPTEAHRDVQLERVQQVLFCKEFELG